MRLDTVTAEIRPRSDWEAVDLGFAMVRRNFWRCFAVWWLAMALPILIAGYLLWDYPGWVLLMFVWLKPAGSRMVMFELSRRLFGEQPMWRAVWREIPRAWYRRFFYRFVWARFSRWLPVTLAVEDLEGLRGKAYKQRSAQVARRGDGVVTWLYFGSKFGALWLAVAILFLVVMLVPEGPDSIWQQVQDIWHDDRSPLVVFRTVMTCLMLAISLTDIFVIGAGFGIYINNRTWIEGWDVELAFKRLAQRLAKVAIFLLAFLTLGMPAMAQEATPKPPTELIKEVKADPDFKVHTVTEKVAKDRPTPSRSHTPVSADFGESLAYLFGICAIGVLLGLLGWLAWKYRHAFHVSKGLLKLPNVKPTARVVMGMEVSSASLPADVPTAAWNLWQQGSHHEALALLYRGAISRVIELGRVEIQESDTEGDCLRRVENIGPSAHPDYFRGITRVWSGLAYAGIIPADSEVSAICQQWPFGERRPR